MKMKLTLVLATFIVLFIAGCAETYGTYTPTNHLSSYTKEVRIALLLPYQKIGKYSASTTNAVFAYLTTKSKSFELKSYKIESESKKDIKEALQKIKDDGFDYVIAPLTQEGADVVASINPNLNIYFPTINNANANYGSSLYYGGIDYNAQTDLLLKEAASSLVLFYDESVISQKLATYEAKQFENNGGKKVIKLSIPSRTTNLKQYLDKNDEIQRASFFINTPIIKTGMIMSQLTLYDANATNVLSTQINYDSLLLSMTQYEDRKNMIVANSITKENTLLIETNELLGNDIVYDWINYTTTVGVDYFFSMITNESREYNIAMQNNQMQYKIELLRPTRYRFINYLSKLE